MTASQKDQSQWWQDWYEGITPRHRLHYQTNLRLVHFEDWLCEQEQGLLGLLSKQDWMYQQDGFLGRVVCVVLGHEVIEDNCGRPEHDHCVYCGVLCPGQAEGR